MQSELWLSGVGVGEFVHVTAGDKPEQMELTVSDSTGAPAMGATLLVGDARALRDWLTGWLEEEK